MHFLASAALALLPILAVNSQTTDNSTSDTFFQDYLSYLTQSGYTSLSSALSQANESDTAQQWISQLSQGNWTIFAPTDEAFTLVPDYVSGNATLLAEYLSYHCVYGNLQNTTSSGGGGAGGGGQTSSRVPPFSSASSQTSAESPAGSVSTSGGSSTVSASSSGSLTATPQPSASAFSLVKWFWPSQNQGGTLLAGVYPNVTIGRTLLNSSDLVQLEGNKSQVLVWTNKDGTFTVLNQIQDTTIGNASQWRNLFIAKVDNVLTPPGDVPTALVAINDQPLLDFANQVQVPLEDGSNGTAVQGLQEARGFTLFAPSSDAFNADVNNAIQQLQDNNTALLSVLQNHYVNGSTVYSPTLMEIGVNSSTNSSQETLISAAGEPFSFSYNETGLFVSNGNGSARVTRPDVLVENGVIHIIDCVLFNTASDGAAASSAFASEASAATQTATDTSPLGVLPIPAPTSGSGIGGGSSGTGGAGSPSASITSSSESSSASTSSPASPSTLQPSSSEPSGSSSEASTPSGTFSEAGSASSPSPTLTASNFRVRFATITVPF